MRRALAFIAVIAGALAVGAPSAMASSALVYQEVVPATGTTFIPACTPGVGGCTDPRGPGSVLITQGNLLQNGSQVGSVTVFCTTTSVVNGDYYGYCEESLKVPGGAIFAHGTVDESAIERFQPQSIAIYAAPGLGSTGTLTIQQTVYPDQFQLTAALS